MSNKETKKNEELVNEKTEEQKTVESQYHQLTTNTPAKIAENVKKENVDYLDINDPKQGNKTYTELKGL